MTCSSVQYENSVNVLHVYLACVQFVSCCQRGGVRKWGGFTSHVTGFHVNIWLTLLSASSQHFDER